jgi:hypothetical protein
VEDHVRLRTKVAVGVTGVAVAGLLAAAVIVSPGASAEEAAAPAAAAAPVPPAIEVPPGNVLSRSMAAIGTQNYRCTAGAWVLVEPSAVLGGVSPTLAAAIHYRGPTWQSVQDGSAVEADRVAGVDNPGSIPLLLLKGKNPRGKGVFTRVSFIQRLRTTGGVAPAGACTEGDERGVRYTAEYRFFVPAA